MTVTKNQKKRSLAPFVLSLVFLPLPFMVGGPFLKELADAISSKMLYGFGPGDALLLPGMSVGLILLFLMPLAGFIWGQKIAWSRSARTLSSFSLYSYFSVIYAAVTATAVWSITL